MVKRKNRSKRSLTSLPKGLPLRGGKGGGDVVNPFEVSSRNKRAKHQVVNRLTQKVTSQSALARALEERKTKLRQEMKQSKKANSFVDRRIGENNRNMTPEEQTLARLVRERARRSKRASKFSLDDNDDDGDENILTHRGKAIDSLTAKDHVILSDDELDEDRGQLDAVDTLQHFGGGSNRGASNPYGPSDGDQTLQHQYSTRKMELDDLITRRKILKAERIKSKETQVDAFEKMDETFDGLAELLNFRDKEKEIRDFHTARKEGTLSEADQEMVDWDKEMRQYQFLDRKVAAVDRIKTPEEIAQEEAERLNELETRRLARMNGEYVDDDFSDISDDEQGKKKRKKSSNPEHLDGDSDDESDSEELTPRFTADGLVNVNKDGEVVGKVGEKRSKQDGDAEEHTMLSAGDRVSACYRAKEQFDGQVTWYEGVITKVHVAKDGSITYDVDYDDGDFEDGIYPEHIRPVEKTPEQKEKDNSKLEEERTLKRKQKRATEKARTEMPFVFEVPTTLEALHDMIGEHAKTGKDATLMIQRIYASNSVRLDRRNTEKMQNFYDVLLRRFIAVGDTIHNDGNGGEELGRYEQLDGLTRVLYSMAQDAPDSAGAVWARRLGILQNAHAKRLRDAEMEFEEEEESSAWPSTGVLLMLRSLGHIFPATDKRHYVVTPAILLLGQFVAHTPVNTMNDLAMGVFCAGLLIEYTKEAKRTAPEAYGFLASVLRLFAANSKNREGKFSNPNLGAASMDHNFQKLRSRVSNVKDTDSSLYSFSVEKETIETATFPAAVLNATLSLCNTVIQTMSNSVESAEQELFADLSEGILALDPKAKKNPLPSFLVDKVAKLAQSLSEYCRHDSPRPPMRRRAVVKKQQVIQSLAPRMENPDKYSMSKDKGKNAAQVAADRTQRELKREKKAISRELRLDAAFVESERRAEQSKKELAAKAKRNKAYTWLEGEQATMNQQVAQGGGLLSGGGMGAARAKARSGKIGVKRGGKF